MNKLPSKSWDAYESEIRSAGEQRPNDGFSSDSFLRDLGFMEEDFGLTERGKEYFFARYVRHNDDSAEEILKNALIEHAPVAALCQLLAGVPTATHETVETVLRNQGFGQELTDRRIGALLSLLNRVGIISYSKAKGRINVLDNPAQSTTTPTSIFISPQTPYGNKIWLRRILEECEGFIYWLDKHFLPAAFEPIWEVADGNRLSEVRILSLAIEQNRGRKALRAYKDLRSELEGRSVSLEWRIIESNSIRDTHDRWIIGRDSARNVPDVGTIYSGNHSEINLSTQQPELTKLFEGYWGKSQSIVQNTGNELNPKLGQEN